MPPNGEHDEPEHIRALYTDELEQRRVPPTPATYAIGAALVLGALLWFALILYRHHAGG